MTQPQESSQRFSEPQDCFAGILLQCDLGQRQRCYSSLFTLFKRSRVGGDKNGLAPRCKETFVRVLAMPFTPLTPLSAPKDLMALATSSWGNSGGLTRMSAGNADFRVRDQLCHKMGDLGKCFTFSEPQLLIHEVGPSLPPGRAAVGLGASVSHSTSLRCLG